MGRIVVDTNVLVGTKLSPSGRDNHLIELAAAGGAEAIVTNNIRDVGRGELSFPHLQVLTPSEFIETQ